MGLFLNSRFLFFIITFEIEFLFEEIDERFKNFQKIH